MEFYLPAIIALIILFCFGVVMLTNPRSIEYEEVDVVDPAGGAPIRRSFPREVWHPWGTFGELCLLPVIMILSMTLCLLVMSSENLISSRQAMWSLVGVANPDGAHAVLDAPGDLDVVKSTSPGMGTATFSIPKGIRPLWVIVNVKKGTESDSIVLPQALVQAGAITFDHKKLADPDTVEVQFGTVTGPSGAALWAKP